MSAWRKYLKRFRHRDSADWMVRKGGACSSWGGLVCGGVLPVGDGLQPRGAVAVLDSFEHRDVAHHAVHTRAVPVLLTGRRPDGVPGCEANDGAVAGHHQTGAVGAQQRLPQGVGVPVGSPAVSRR
jgi:hypothetical protein